MISDSKKMIFISGCEDIAPSNQTMPVSSGFSFHTVGSPIYSSNIVFEDVCTRYVIWFTAHVYSICISCFLSCILHLKKLMSKWYISVQHLYVVTKVALIFSMANVYVECVLS
jgi:hypothetical protein